MTDLKISELAAVTDLQGTDLLELARAGANKKITGADLTSEVLAAVAGGLFSAYAYIRHQEAQGVVGGTFTSGAWRTRTLNTEVYDPDGIVSLSSNQFTLQAGTYFIIGRAPVLACERNACRLQNVTDATTVAYGSSCYPASGTSNPASYVFARTTIAGAKAFELQHRCASTAASLGFGTYINQAGLVEVYGEVEIWKEA